MVNTGSSTVRASRRLSRRQGTTNSNATAHSSIKTTRTSTISPSPAATSSMVIATSTKTATTSTMATAASSMAVATSTKTAATSSRSPAASSRDGVTSPSPTAASAMDVVTSPSPAAVSAMSVGTSAETASTSTRMTTASSVATVTSNSSRWMMNSIRSLPTQKRLAILLTVMQLVTKELPSPLRGDPIQFVQAFMLLIGEELSRVGVPRSKVSRGIEWRTRVFTPHMTPNEFRSNFRLTKASFARLLWRLEPHITKKTTTFGRPLSAPIRLAVFLYYAGQGCSLHQLRSQFGIGKSTASGIVRDVSNAVVSCMSNLVKFPSGRQELLKLAMQFEDGYGVPGENSKKFYNRKGFYSLNMSAVVDRDRRFLDIDVRWPGSVGDNRVFSNSAAGRLHESEFSAASGDEGAGVLQTGWFEHRKIPFFLLPDSAYANSRHVVTTYEIAETLNSVVISKVNRKLAGMRYCVECAFGILKARWRLLSKPMEIARTSLEEVPTVVSAVCILHNFVIDECDGVWDVELERKHREFYFANYLQLTNEQRCPGNEVVAGKTRDAIQSWMQFRDSVRSS